MTMQRTSDREALAQKLATSAASPPDVRATADVRTTLAAIGCALDDGHEIPGSLRRWMEKLDRATIETALLQNAGTDVCEDSFVRLAVTRVTMARGWAPVKAGGPRDASEAPSTFANDAPHEGTPSDETVTAYLTRGTFAKYVEHTANRDPAFAEELETCTRALVDAREPVSHAAMRWHRGRDASTMFASQPKRAPWFALAIAAALLLAWGSYAAFSTHR
jgi:hypothetical protein